jgi:hypothetical protein
LNDASKEVGLVVNAEKTKYMLMSCHQNAGENHIIDALENVAPYRYLGTTVTNQDLIHKEINSRLYSGNVCYHSYQNIFSSHLLFRNIKIRIYKNEFFVWFCMGVKLCL